MFLMEEINGLDKLHSGMSCTVLLAMSAGLVSQPDKGPSHRNIWKTKLWINRLADENVLTQRCKEPHIVFLPGTVFQDSLT